MSSTTTLLRRSLGWLSRLTALVMIGLVRLYQIAISPLLGQRCRFWPSCSSYTREAIEVHGPIKGAGLGMRRISRCHPGCEGGIDPVPGGPSEALCREDPELDELFRIRSDAADR